MNFPQWIDLKGMDGVAETVHHVTCMTDAINDKQWIRIMHSPNHLQVRCHRIICICGQIDTSKSEGVTSVIPLVFPWLWVRQFYRYRRRLKGILDFVHALITVQFIPLHLYTISLTNNNALAPL